MSARGDYTSHVFALDVMKCSYSCILAQEDDQSFSYSHARKTVFEKHFFNRVLKLLHGEFSSGLHSGKRLLEIGCGPGIIGAMSASKIFDEIILSDIGPYSLKEVRKWLDKEYDALDWTPALTYVANMEGNRMSADRVAQRLRKAVKYTMYYDIHDPSPLRGSVDCITSLLVLDTASSDLKNFQDNLDKIVSMLTGPGATVILSLVLNLETGFVLADKLYPSINISKEVVLSCLAKAGLTCMNVIEDCLLASSVDTCGRNVLFVSATIAGGNKI